MTKSHDELGHTLSPNFDGAWVRGVRVTTNKDGFRDVDYAKKGADEIRILSLGDSNAFGYGVTLQDSYPKLVQRHLQNRFPTCRISVINAAVFGYSTFHQLRIFEKFFPRYNPDFVLWTFSASNDGIENAVMTSRASSDNNPQVAGFLADAHLLRLSKRALTPAIYFLENRTGENLDTTLALMSKMAGQLDSKHVPNAAVIIPARHQVRPSVHIGSFILELVGLRSLNTKQNDVIIDYFQRAGIAYADTLQRLKKDDTAEPVMFGDDNHPNRNGHRIIARLVSDKIGPQISKIAARKCQVRIGTGSSAPR